MAQRHVKSAGCRPLLCRLHFPLLFLGTIPQACDSCGEFDVLRGRLNRTYMPMLFLSLPCVCVCVRDGERERFCGMH